jgi:hypothetical protein
VETAFEGDDGGVALFHGSGEVLTLPLAIIYSDSIAGRDNHDVRLYLLCIPEQVAKGSDVQCGRRTDFSGTFYGGSAPSYICCVVGYPW